MEADFIDTFVAKLLKNPDVELLGFCGHRRLRKRNLKQFWPALCTYSFGILPLVKGDAFFTTRSGLSGYRPRSTPAIHVFHSPASMHLIYPEDTFSEFDAFFATGPHHAVEARALSKVKGKRYDVYAVGSGVIDKYIESRRAERQDNGVSNVVYAPTWGAASSIVSWGKEVIETLLSLGVHLTLRPHCMTIIKNKALLLEIEKKHSENPGFVIDWKPNGIISNDFDVLVTDWSGVAVEFALGYKKPALFLDTPQKILNPNWQHYISYRGIEFEYRDQMGVVVSSPKEIPAALLRLEADHVGIAKRLEDTTEKLVYYPGDFANQACKALYSFIDQRSQKQRAA